MKTSFRWVALAGALASLAGCAWFGGDEDKHRAANSFTGTEDTTETITLGNGDGLNLPVSVLGFTRKEVRVGDKSTEASATYIHDGAPGTIIATVRAHQLSAGGSIIPFTGDSSPAATKAHSDVALSALIAEVTKSHPDAAVLGREDVFLVRFGVLQAGRAATLSATDTIGGVSQPVRVRVESFCCINGKWDYEYRYEAPVAVQARELERAFSHAIAWSREAAASVDTPE